MTQVRPRPKVVHNKYYVCERCGRKMLEVKFYTDKEGKRYLICKDCLTRNIDNKKQSTFDWILKVFDVPFVKNLWLDLCKRSYKRDPDRFGSASVIGNYLKVMKTPAYIGYTYNDAELATRDYNARNGYELNTINSEKEEQFIQEAKKKLEDENLDPIEREKLEQLIQPNLYPDVSELEKMVPQSKYDRYYSKEAQERKQKKKEEKERKKLIQERVEKEFAEEEARAAEKKENEESSEDLLDYEAALAAEGIEIHSKNDVQKFLDTLNQDRALTQEKRISDSLTEDDVNMLSVKWGSDYRPSEWLRLEEMYRKYTNEFEMNVDREEVLKMMCKTSLKMDQALDEGNIADYTKLQSAFDALRKSGKFTEAQNKDKQDKYLDSVGELVAAVEKQGGIIPQFDYKFETTQDKVDFTLKDMQSYTYNLVRNEMGLGNLIETYIQKLDQANAQGSMQSLTEGLVTSRAEEEAAGELAAEQYSNEFDSKIQAEMDAMFADMDGE